MDRGKADQIRLTNLIGPSPLFRLLLIKLIDCRRQEADISDLPMQISGWLLTAKPVLIFSQLPRQRNTLNCAKLTLSLTQPVWISLEPLYRLQKLLMQAERRP